MTFRRQAVDRSSPSLTLEPMQITPVILAGGGGARLWPLSRPDWPKPLLKLLGPRSLLQETAARFADDARFAPPMLSVGQAFAAGCLHDLAEIGAAPTCTVVEPEGRNTAAAIAAAALAAPAGALLLMAPADHAIGAPAIFCDAVARAAAAVGDGLAVFGVTPDRPETGYGYIVPALQPRVGALRPIGRFTEKPSHAAASELIGAGALWNAGLFLGRRESFLAAFETHAPDILAAVTAALPAEAATAGVINLTAAFGGARTTPFDKAIMERTDVGLVADLAAGWSDVGDWAAVWRASGKDADGNVMIGDVVAVNCRGCYLRGEGVAARAADLSDMIVIATPEATLTLPLSAAQTVRRLAGPP